MNRYELADSVNALVERSMPVDVPGDAEFIAATVDACRNRFLGTGTKYQISENEQSFERSTLGTMAKGMREELQDGVNYAVMLDILIGRQAADPNVSPAEFEVGERLRLFCETVTCLLVDFDRELQEALTALGYEDDGFEYTDTLADEVNASGARAWSVVDVPFVVHEAKPEIGSRQWPDGVPIALGAGANEGGLIHSPEIRAALVGGLQPKTVFGVAVEDVDYTPNVDSVPCSPGEYPTPDSPEGLDSITGDDDVGDYAVDIARLYDDGCGQPDEDN